MSKNQLIIAGLLVCLIVAAIPSVLGAATADGAKGGAPIMSTAPRSTVGLQQATAAVYSDVATDYWLELKAYPSTNTRALWLFAGDDWRYLSNPSSNIENSVQQAFANPDLFDVQVWYSGNVIVGLVVNTK